jgi:hypothetical protein
MQLYSCCHCSVAADSICARLLRGLFLIIFAAAGAHRRRRVLCHMSAYGAQWRRYGVQQMPRLSSSATQQPTLPWVLL